ncbi:hypothetical protein [Kosakonia sp. R1.Fl]|uniref:hypothetical protein n=1 Tax=Kosakonia sp. R1.Fl TaxID=2928706 RepID=UPI00201D3606|nr:hypothetical protein [Kosakonia sp. R1.Fl]MCL6742796.1 hypothetical protein [Kosakonia sp. R1.Fl]
MTHKTKATVQGRQRRNRKHEMQGNHIKGSASDQSTGQRNFVLADEITKLREMINSSREGSQ